ncbi:MAG: glycosyltransferase, partial [Bacteroidota bacterium]
MKAPRRLLLINYYWPPSGGVGVLRTLKFAKYLRLFGWEPVIYTAKDAHYPSQDVSNVKDIPTNLEVLRQPILEPHGIYQKLKGKSSEGAPKDILYLPDQRPGLTQRLSLWTRANLFVPDARALWVRPSVRFLKDYLKEHPVDAILSSGPPHSNTMIAAKVKAAIGLPWIADWRDPWTQADYFQGLPLSSWGLKRHQRMEQRALQLADRTLIVSEHWAEDLRKIGGHEVYVLTNGFDPDDFANLVPQPTERFSFTHLGILGEDRIPHNFLRVAAELCQSDPAFAEKFELQLIGQVSPAIREKGRAYGLQDHHFKILEQQARDQALSLAAGSSFNLLMLNQQENAAGRIPFKLFEYLALGRPILGFGPSESDVNTILRRVHYPGLFTYEDQERLKLFLGEAFQ